MDGVVTEVLRRISLILLKIVFTGNISFELTIEMEAKESTMNNEIFEKLTYIVYYRTKIKLF